jgi:alkylation response protein AidB-like acyl-CoA dehydrogenase
MTEPAPSAPTTATTPAELAALLRRRLDGSALAGEHAERFESFEDAIARQRVLQAVLWDEGWTRWGWPVSCGGCGGSVRHRAVIYEQLAEAGLAVPEPYQILEVAGSALLKFAPEIAAVRVPRAVRGDEVWSLGLSEPDSGSDLGSVRTRLSPGSGEGRYAVSGHKIWNGFAQLSDFSFTLCRTGGPEEKHAGLTIALIDLRNPGVIQRPIMAITGRNEYAEIFFDDVTVPADHLIGGVGQGWSVIAFLMQYERGTYAWPRQARLHHRADELVATMIDRGVPDARRLGELCLDLAALRVKGRQSLRQLAAEGGPGSAASVDKLLLSHAERAVAEFGHDVVLPDVELGSGGEAARWRYDYIYHRALSIFGGTSEVQRNIVAERLLGLPRG